MKIYEIMGFPGGSDSKDSASNPQTWVQSLGQEDSLKKGMATHSRILVQRIPWTEEPSGLQSMGSLRVRHNSAFFSFTFHKKLLIYVCLTHLFSLSTGM